MMINGALDPRDDIDGISVSRYGVRVDSVYTSMNRLEHYIKRAKKKKIYYTNQNQHKPHKYHQKSNNQKAKMGRKATVRLFQTTNKQNLWKWKT